MFTCSIPIVKRFLVENFLSRQKRTPKWRFFGDKGDQVLFFLFSNPKRYILARNHVFNVFCVIIGSGAWLWPPVRVCDVNSTHCCQLVFPMQ